MIISDSIKIHFEVFGDLPDLESDRSSVAKWSKLVELLIIGNKSLRKINYELENPDVIIVIEATRDRFYYETMRKKHLKAKMILVMIETPSVNPVQHSFPIRRLFDYFFVPNSSSLANKYNATCFDIPLEIQDIKSVDTCSHKSTLSFGYVGTSKNQLVKSCLYSLRPKILNLISKNYSIILGGKDWQVKLPARLKNDASSCLYLIRHRIRPRISKMMLVGVKVSRLSYSGEISDRQVFLKNCKIIICMENDKFELSEKLFDILSMGKIPLYIGSNPKLCGISEDLFLYGGTSVSECRKTIESINEEIIKTKLRAIEDGRHEVLRRWSIEVAMPRLAEKVNRLIKSSMN